MNVALYLVGGILLCLFLYGLIAAGIGLLFWLVIGAVIVGLTVLGLRQWWQSRKPSLPKTLSEKRVERKADRALRDLERSIENEPEKQRLGR